MRHGSRFAFALYEVLIGLAIFSIGVVALGRAVGNCINASELRADDARVREILAGRMAEIQTAPNTPDENKDMKIDTGFGDVHLLQKTTAQEITENDAVIPGLRKVLLTANWQRDGARQSKQIVFYVYRAR